MSKKCLRNNSYTGWNKMWNDTLFEHAAFTDSVLHSYGQVGNFCFKLYKYILPVYSLHVKNKVYQHEGPTVQLNIHSVCQYGSVNICCSPTTFDWVPSAEDFYCPFTFSRPPQPEKCATDGVYSKSPSTVWHFIFLPYKSLSLIPYIDLTQPLLAKIQPSSVMRTGVCVCVLDVDVLCLWCGSRSCWAGLLWIWLHSQGQLHSGNQPPPSSTSIHTFYTASTLLPRPNGA